MNASPSLTDPHCIQYRPTNPGVSIQPHTDPEWQAISAALGEQDDRDEDRADSREQTASVLRTVLAYITHPADVRAGDWQKLAGRRAVAVRLALDPDAFGKSVSLRSLCRALDVSTSNLCRLTQQARAEFGLRPVNEKPASLLKADGQDERFTEGEVFHIVSNSTNKGGS